MSQLSDLPELRILLRIAKRLMHRCRADQDIRELVSDGYLGMIRARHTFDPSHKVPAHVYERRCIRFAMLEGMRTRCPVPKEFIYRDQRPAIVRFEACADPVRVFSDRLATVDQADVLITPLPDRTWFALQLYYYEQHEMKQIGRRFGITEAGVCLMLSRAFKKIAATAIA